jgi:N-acetylglucosamine-6-phosphate deacetylase
MSWSGQTMDRLRCVDPSFADERGAWITPGLMDLQINGIRGINFNDASLSVEQIEAADTLIRADGVSRYCPTIITCSMETALAAISSFRRAWESGRLPGVIGIHMEGPWISDQDGPRGVHRRELVRDVSLPEWETLQVSAGGRIRLLTLAPERRGAMDLVKSAVRSGAVVSLGHTAATDADIGEAVKAGARMSTHLFNGCARLLDRHSNVVYAQLAEDALSACFISDGHHVPFSTLRIGIRTKGVSRSILVSDLTHLSGLPDGEHEMEGSTVVVRDGAVRVKDSNLLSGAARTLRQDVELLAREVEPGIESALIMSSLSPAAALGERAWADLCEGRRGPVAVFSWDGSRLALEQRLGF